MASTWQGHYLDGRTAVRQPAAVRLMREGLEVTTAAGGTRLWPYRELRQTQGFYAGEPVRLERAPGPGETLVVEDAGFLARLHDAAPGLGRPVHDPRRRSRRLALTVLAAVGLVAIAAGLYRWGIPGLARLAAPRVPAAWEAALGQAVLDSAAGGDRRCVDPAREALLARVVARLAAPGPRPPHPVRVHVVDAPLENAYALPGGHVVLFRPLLARLRGPDELAGVLAHEYAHVVRRHALERLLQHASTGLLLAALTGDTTGPLAYGLETARVLGELAYSRRAEEEADADAVRRLAAAGLDPEGLVRFLEAVAAGSGAAAPAAARYASTHPPAPDRVARVRALALPGPAAPEPAMSAAEWADLGRICRGRAPGVTSPRSSP